MSAAMIGCGDGSAERAARGRTEVWDAASTWPEQEAKRREVADAAARAFDGPALAQPGVSEELRVKRLVDGLRGVAVTRVEPAGLAEERDADPWRARLLRRSPRLVASESVAGSSVEALEAELRRCADAEGPGVLVRECAIRASLAQGLVQDALRLRGSLDLYESELRKALEAVDGWCQLPEAILNRAAIHLELARVVEARSATGGGDSEPIVSDHLRRADAALLELLVADASSCEETRGGFFGSFGVGGRFAYVLDKSTSMAEAGGFDQLRRKIADTLDGLPPDTSFSVLFFSERPRRGVAEPQRSYAEIAVTEGFGDGTGMFRRGNLGARSGGQLDAIIKAIDSVVPDGRTEPAEALERALDLRATSIFLLTDGVIETDDARLDAIAARARAQGALIHSTLFFKVSDAAEDPTGFTLERGLRKLQKLARDTGGSVVVATQASGSGAAPRIDDASSGATSSLLIRGRFAETLRDRMVRRGYWTPESQRQFDAIKAELDARAGDYPSASARVESALRASSPDVVTLASPEASASANWPRLGDGTPMPLDAALVLESAGLLALQGRHDEAEARFDAAARTCSTAMQAADAAGRPAEASFFADLGCRALLLGALVREDSEDLPRRSPRSASLALVRAEELGLVRASGWSQMLLAAGGGSLSNLRAGVQHWLAGDDAGMSAELDLVRAFYRRGAEVPDSRRFVGFPIIERLLLSQVADAIRQEESS